jgi:hypothetical protein
LEKKIRWKNFSFSALDNENYEETYEAVFLIDAQEKK